MLKRGNWYTINNTKCPCRRRLTEVTLRQTVCKRDVRLTRAMQSWMHVTFPAARTMRARDICAHLYDPPVRGTQISHSRVCTGVCESLCRRAQKCGGANENNGLRSRLYLASDLTRTGPSINSVSSARIQHQKYHNTFISYFH